MTYATEWSDTTRRAFNSSGALDGTLNTTFRAINKSASLHRKLFLAELCLTMTRVVIIPSSRCHTISETYRRLASPLCGPSASCSRLRYRMSIFQGLRRIGTRTTCRPSTQIRIPWCVTYLNIMQCRTEVDVVCIISDQ